MPTVKDLYNNHSSAVKLRLAGKYILDEEDGELYGGSLPEMRVIAPRIKHIPGMGHIIIRDINEDGSRGPNDGSVEYFPEDQLRPLYEPSASQLGSHNIGYKDIQTPQLFTGMTVDNTPGPARFVRDITLVAPLAAGLTMSPFIATAAKGVVGGAAVDAGMYGLTGDTWSEYLKKHGWNETVAEVSNPGYLVGTGIYSKLGSGVLNGGKKMFTFGKNLLKKRPNYFNFNTNNSIFSFNNSNINLLDEDALKDYVPTFKYLTENVELPEKNGTLIKRTLDYSPLDDEVIKIQDASAQSLNERAKKLYSFFTKSKRKGYDAYIFEQRLNNPIMQSKRNALNLGDPNDVKKYNLFDFFKEDGQTPLDVEEIAEKLGLKYHENPMLMSQFDENEIPEQLYNMLLKFKTSPNEFGISSTEPFVGKSILTLNGHGDLHEIIHALEEAMYTFERAKRLDLALKAFKPKFLSDDYFYKPWSKANPFTEISARGTLLKNALGFTGDEQITKQQLQWLKENYAKKFGDNDITDLFNGIQDEDAFLEWINNYSFKHGGKLHNF